MRIIPNSNQNLHAIVWREDQSFLVPIIYWFEATDCRYPIPVDRLQMHLEDIRESRIGVYDSVTGNVFGHNGTIYNAIQDYEESQLC